MVLYIVHDSSNDTYSHPLIASTWSEVSQSFLHLNPSNLSTLSILPLSQDFDSLPELVSKLQLISESELPDPILFNKSGESSLSPTQQPKGVSPMNPDHNNPSYLKADKASLKKYKYDDPEWQAEASIRSKRVHAEQKQKKQS